MSSRVYKGRRRDTTVHTPPSQEGGPAILSSPRISAIPPRWRVLALASLLLKILGLSYVRMLCDTFVCVPLPRFLVWGGHTTAKPAPREPDLPLLTLPPLELLFPFPVSRPTEGGRGMASFAQESSADVMATAAITLEGSEHHEVNGTYQRQGRYDERPMWQNERGIQVRPNRMSSRKEEHLEAPRTTTLPLRVQRFWCKGLGASIMTQSLVWSGGQIWFRSLNGDNAQWRIGQGANFYFIAIGDTDLPPTDGWLLANKVSGRLAMPLCGCHYSRRCLATRSRMDQHVWLVKGLYRLWRECEPRLHKRHHI
jgi:hypothetical protein